MRSLSVVVVLLGLSLPAAAAVTATAPSTGGTGGLGLGKHDANAPIQVSADTFLADINQKTGTYSGNVLVTQGDFHLRADKVRVNVVDGKPDRIFANGNVVFAAPNGTAKGDDGVYDVAPRLITLTGHVILTKEKNVMRGSTLTVNLVTGSAQLGNSGGRVQGLFTPPPQQSQPKPQTQTQTPVQTPVQTTYPTQPTQNP